jgi:hypothetical protein
MLRSVVLLAAVLIPGLANAQSGRGSPVWAGALDRTQINSEMTTDAAPESGAIQNIETPDYTAESFRLAQAPELLVEPPGTGDGSAPTAPAFKLYDPNTEFDIYWTQDPGEAAR